MSEANYAVVISISVKLTWRLQIRDLSEDAELHKLKDVGVLQQDVYTVMRIIGKQISLISICFFSLCHRNYAYASGVQYMVVKYSRNCLCILIIFMVFMELQQALAQLNNFYKGVVFRLWKIFSSLRKMVRTCVPRLLQG